MQGPCALIGTNFNDFFATTAQRTLETRATPIEDLTCLIGNLPDVPSGGMRLFFQFFMRFFVFRPISVLPVLSKVFEKLVAIQMTNYADHAHLLHDRISAFRKGHSTTTALLRVRDDILLCHEKERGHTYGVSRFLEGF